MNVSFGVKKMNLQKNKMNKMFSIVTLILLLLFTSFVANTPIAKAANIKTYAYLSVNPNRISLGEQTVVNAWLQPIPPTGADVFHGFTVKITKPDGNSETQGPLTSSPIGSQYFNYRPTMLGTYTFQFTYPGEDFAGGTVTYLPSETPVSTLVVQEEPIPGRPETPLPSDYWNRPINARNRLWTSIAGDWLMRGYNTSYSQGPGDAAKGFNPYSQAPRSPHVIYTKELGLGGLIGGEYDTTSFYAGLTYEAKLTPPIIMDGKMYYRIYPSDFGYYQGGAGAWPGAVCVDLRTGEELWRNENMSLDAGQILNYVSPNQMGGIPYLWDLASFGPFAFFGVGPSLLFRPASWHLYDGNTGDLIATFKNAFPASFIQAGTVVYGADGTMYVYILSGPAGWLAMWNSTKAIAAANFIPDIPGSHVPFLRNLPGTYNWSTGIQWNVTVPVHMVMDSSGPLFQAASGVTGNVLIAAVESRATSYKEIGYSLTTGEQLWVHDLDADHYTAARTFGEGVYVGMNPNQRVWFGYDADTGASLWTSDPTDYPWGTYGLSALIAYGKLYALSYDGSVHAYDLETGKEVFKYYSGDDIYRETPYGTFPFYFGPIIADGVVFAGNGEHSPSLPLYRGFKLHAFDAQTGTPVWNLSGWHVIQAIADGYLVSYNAEDNRMYIFGKGPSATTVTVPMTAMQVGQSFTITGTVTDQSQGAKGTPAISDQDMSAWVEYLYMQQPIPTDAKGVTIKLTALDPNNNVIDIGEATSDTKGNFALTWAPEVPGLYQIIATFAGSESYGSSYETTYLSAVEAPLASPTPPPISLPPTETYVIGFGVAIIIAIAIVGILILRKR